MQAHTRLAEQQAPSAELDKDISGLHTLFTFSVFFSKPLLGSLLSPLPGYF